MRPTSSLTHTAMIASTSTTEYSCAGLNVSAKICVKLPMPFEET